MILARHLAKVLFETVRFGISTRRFVVVAVILVGFVLVALAFTAQTVAPLAVYPFA